MPTSTAVDLFFSSQDDLQGPCIRPRRRRLRTGQEHKRKVQEAHEKAEREAAERKKARAGAQVGIRSWFYLH